MGGGHGREGAWRSVPLLSLLTSQNLQVSRVACCLPQLLPFGVSSLQFFMQQIFLKLTRFSPPQTHAFKRKYYVILINRRQSITWHKKETVNVTIVQ